MTVVDGNTSPKGLVVIVVSSSSSSSVRSSSFASAVTTSRWTPGKSASKLSIVCFGSTRERGAMSARASASPEAARAKRSYRAISPVNSSFSLMALVNSARRRRWR